MNTLESMRARQAEHARQQAWKANIRRSDPAPDRTHAPVDVHARLRAIDADRAQRGSARTRDRRVTQSATASSARRSRERWTPEDLAIALDMSLSARQAALKLGRSLYAVNDKRKQCRR